MKIKSARNTTPEQQARYGCGNCIREDGECRGDKRDCELRSVIAEQLTDDDKIGGLVKVLDGMKLKVVVKGNSFNIVSY
jgi:hypothetical protein